MTESARNGNELVEQALDLWETAVRKAQLAAGDTFTIQWPASFESDDSGLALIRNALAQQGFTVGHTKGSGGFTVTRTSMPASTPYAGEGRVELHAEGSSSTTGSAHIELHAEGSASGTSQASKDDVLNDIFQMLGLIAQQQQSSSPLPFETVVALLSLLTSVLALLGYSK